MVDFWSLFLLTNEIVAQNSFLESQSGIFAQSRFISLLKRGARYYGVWLSFPLVFMSFHLDIEKMSIDEL